MKSIKKLTLIQTHKPFMLNQFNQLNQQKLYKIILIFSIIYVDIED